MFIPTKPGQGKGWSWGCDHQWCFGLFPDVMLAWANWDLWLKASGKGTSQEWLRNAATLHPPPILGFCVSWGVLLSEETLLKCISAQISSLFEAH